MNISQDFFMRNLSCVMTRLQLSGRLTWIIEAFIYILKMGSGCMETRRLWM